MWSRSSIERGNWHGLHTVRCSLRSESMARSGTVSKCHPNKILTARTIDEAGQYSTVTTDGSTGFCIHLIQLVSSTIGCEQPVSIWLPIYPIIRHLLYAYGPVLLRSDHFQMKGPITELCRRILGHCTSTNIQIRLVNPSGPAVI